MMEAKEREETFIVKNACFGKMQNCRVIGYGLKRGGRPLDRGFENDSGRGLVHVRDGTFLLIYGGFPDSTKLAIIIAAQAMLSSPSLSRSFVALSAFSGEALRVDENNIWFAEKSDLN